MFKDAASHWVFESAVFLPFYKDLKQIYPNLIVYIDGFKTYKRLFCEYFNVPYTSTFVSGATVIIPEQITSLVDNANVEKYKLLLDSFWEEFERLRNRPIDNPLLIMPRQKLENYKNNDREIAMDAFINCVELCRKTHAILNTDTITMLEDQANIVAKSSTIVLCAGAALHINSLFAKGKTIYVVGEPDMMAQSNKFVKAKLLLEKAMECNTIVFGNQQTVMNALIPKIVLFGDSHARFSFEGLDLPHVNLNQSSHTMHRVSRDKALPNFNKNLDTNNAIFLFAFGEIDARCQIYKQLEVGRSLEEIISKLTTDYIDAILQNIQISKKIIITAIIPPTRRHDYESRHGPITHEFPFLGTDEERVKYTGLVNKELKQICEKHKLFYLDPYEYYRREDGTLKYEYSDNCVHVGPAHAGHVISQLKELLFKEKLLL
jgi:hypothetical protein